MRIFLLTLSLFGSILSCQPPVCGQTPPPGQDPIPTFPSKPGAIPTPLKVLPDLQIIGMKYDKAKCTIHINVANHGRAGAGPFDVWLNFVGMSSWDRPTQVVKADGLAGLRDIWITYTAWNVWMALGGDKCFLDTMIRTQAVADARYLDYPETLGPETGAGGLIKPGYPIPKGMKVVESRIQESNENNNELVVNKADMKAWP